MKIHWSDRTDIERSISSRREAKPHENVSKISAIKMLWLKRKGEKFIIKIKI